MVNTNGPKSGDESIDDKAPLEERQADATSKETLSDVEEDEADVGSSDSGSGPSPDGALDEGDEIKDAGPM